MFNKDLTYWCFWKVTTSPDTACKGQDKGNGEELFKMAEQEISLKTKRVEKQDTISDFCYGKVTSQI